METFDLVIKAGDFRIGGERMQPLEAMDAILSYTMMVPSNSGLVIELYKHGDKGEKDG
jgi:hypothetical protein